ncbi:MAG TPA: acyltransferase [Bacillota bacterium]
MRPVKQAGVISTHTLVTFAPAAASVSSGAVLLLLHVSRLGFFFVSSYMLTYAYRDLSWRGLPRFYRRRFVSAGVPYLCWTLVYFFFLTPTVHYHGIGPALKGLATMAETGYYRLYFLLVIMQFYVVFPLVLALTAVSALAAEGVCSLARCGVTTVLGSSSDPFQPSVIPFNIGAIACCYLAGVALVGQWQRDGLRVLRQQFTEAT